MSNRIFKTQGEVLDFLHGLGLKISRAKLSKDYRTGTLRCQPDKTFLENDVSAYAETLKAPDFNPETNAESPERRQLKRLKAMVLDFCAAIPDMDAIANALEKWMEKNGNDSEIAQKLAVCQRRVARRIRELEEAKAREAAVRDAEREETSSQSKPKAELADYALSVEYRGRHHILTPDMIKLPEIPGGYDKMDSIDLRARFCLTGIFTYGKRGECEKLVESMGGKVARYPVMYEQSYVVVGNLVSLVWSHEFFHGNKIEQGLKCRSQGGPVKIITEDDWIRLVMAHERSEG